MKKVNQQEGIVLYNSKGKYFTIVVSIPNTFDSQDIGVVCNLPTELRMNGQKVIFDGEYREYDKVPQTIIGGQTYYYLLLSKVNSF